MKKLELKYRKLLRAMFGCISLTAVAFVFQACYGTDHDMFYDVKMTGTVRSKTTHLPIKGIKVAIEAGRGSRGYNYGYTDENGRFDFYASVPEREYYYYEDSTIVRYPPGSVAVQFLDVDSLENGWFEDDVIIIDPAHKNEVKIHVELKEKQE
jgi:hypothetical protein